jgi:hypothetical protein
MSSPGAAYVGEGMGAGLAGYGLSMNPQLQQTNPLQYLQGDQSAIGGAAQQQQGMTNQYVNQLGQLGNQDYQNLTSQLGPQGQLGQQLAGEYNNYGITPQSGAFQEGLGNQYGNLLNQVNSQQASALGQGYQGQTGLSNLGLQQQFGLEGQQSNASLADSLAQFQQQTGLQQALIGGGSNIAAQGAGGGGK